MRANVNLLKLVWCVQIFFFLLLFVQHNSVLSVTFVMSVLVNYSIICYCNPVCWKLKACIIGLNVSVSKYFLRLFILYKWKYAFLQTYVICSSNTMCISKMIPRFFTLFDGSYLCELPFAPFLSGSGQWVIKPEPRLVPTLPKKKKYINMIYVYVW